MTPAIESKDRSPAPLIRSGGMTLVDVQPAEPADPDVRIEIRCPSCDRSVIVRIADLIRALGDESTFTCPLGHALYPLPDSIRDQIRQMQNDLSDRTSQVDHMFIEMTRIQIEIAKLRPAINYLNDPQLLISRDDTAEQLEVIVIAAARIGSICD